LAPACVMKHLRPGGDRDIVIRRFRDGNWEDAAELFLNQFQRRGPSRFFPGVSDKAVEDLISCACREEQQQVIANAEAAWQGKFNILGYGLLSFDTAGGNPDWHFDPVMDRHSPRIHWSRIDPLNPEQVGDSKV